VKALVKQMGLFLVYGSVGAVVVLIAVVAFYMESRADLAIWHTIDLENEFDAEASVETFADYLSLEQALFRELQEKVVNQVESGAGNRFNRYAAGSRSSPDRYAQDWNRSFEFSVEQPKAAALLLHGMSDSPYSMRGLAERLHAQGVHVLGLRFPGHGTAPAVLTGTTWEDMAAATHLAARYLAMQADGAPLYVFGYSTGGSLAVELALAALDDSSLPDAAGLVLLSPAMGVTPLAALTPWQARLGRMLGLRKFAWNTISVEYDPFKYRSFPLNAAIQVWRLSDHIVHQIDAQLATGGLEGMPPVLTFQSVIDDTIDVQALLRHLYEKLPTGGHHLVAYDINRTADMEELLAHDPGPALDALLVDQNRAYDLSVVTNLVPTSEQMVIKYGAAGSNRVENCALEARWPADAYSLAHIALPFAPDDPLYGGPDALPAPGISLGNVVLRGEGSVLRISPAGFLRQSWNPFFEIQFETLARFMGLAVSPASCSPV
jgi:alpha-beta hydrolase superfamily lysophospholipase